MKAKKLQEMSTPDLNKKLAEIRETLRTTRFGVTGARAKNVKATRTNRVLVARILTILTSRKTNA